MSTVASRVIHRRRGDVENDKKKIILLIDNSGSTGQYGRFIAIQKYVNQQLKDFDEEKIDLQKLYYFSNSLQEIKIDKNTKSKVDNVYPDGCTSLFKYIHEIGEDVLNLDDDLSNYSFVVVTDGENTTQPHFWDKAVNTIKELKEKNCKILYAAIESNPFTEISRQALDLGYPEEFILSINCYDQRYMNEGLDSLRQVSASQTVDGFSQVQRQSSQPIDDFFDLDDKESNKRPIHEDNNKLKRLKRS